MILHQIFFVAVAFNPSTMLSSPASGRPIMKHFLSLYESLGYKFESFTQNILGEYNVKHTRVIKCDWLEKCVNFLAKLCKNIPQVQDAFRPELRKIFSASFCDKIDRRLNSI